MSYKHIESIINDGTLDFVLEDKDTLERKTLVNCVVTDIQQPNSRPYDGTITLSFTYTDFKENKVDEKSS